MNIKDVAKICGVGVSTVSRVINNHPDVKGETRKKVLEVIEDINYIPNNSARILKRNNTMNIGVLLKGVFNPFFTEMLKIIGYKIEEAGYTMILQHYDNSNGKDEDALRAFIKEKRLQGVICLGGNFLNITEDSFHNLKTPVVLTSVNVNLDKLGDNISSIGIDNEKAAYEATSYLINLGHKNIAVLLGDEDDVGIGSLRLNGYKRAMEENNINFKKEYILYGYYECEKAYKASYKLLKKQKDISAIFAISDIMAIGVSKAIFNLGLVPGKNISIMGFDGMEIGEYYEPSITTLKQPRNQIAKESVELLFDLINKKIKNRHILLKTNLIERDSCKEFGKQG